jgi:hypothetical protein
MPLPAAIACGLLSTILGPIAFGYIVGRFPLYRLGPLRGVFMFGGAVAGTTLATLGFAQFV